MNCQLFAVVVYLVNTKFQIRQLIALLKAMDSKLLGKSFRYRFYSIILVLETGRQSI